MEVAGLAVGVIGLAGLIGAFKDVVDLFYRFDFGHLEKDTSRLLYTKLDIEKAMLLQWSERVRLLQDHHDPCLSIPETKEAVVKLLACIRSLIGDANQIKSQYGVQVVRISEDAPIPLSHPDHSTSICEARMEQFTAQFERLELGTEVTGTLNSLRRKFRWVIRDRQKFENLHKELAYLVTRLNDLTPPTADRARDGQILSALDPRNPTHLTILKKAWEASTGMRWPIADAAQQTIDRFHQDQIIQRLWFRKLTNREESIDPAHRMTMLWALETPANDTPWDNLTEWLRTGSGIYWVSGKAGSGKSTLMKFLFRNPKTTRLISDWAEGGPSEALGFFFWNLGSPEEKTQEGLSRSLLYQILFRNRSLVPKALPNMWMEIKTAETAQRGVELPSTAETRQAFRVLAESSSGLGKICLFIDGLDEFEGDHRDIITFLHDLTSAESIKAVISSRPIPECVAAFSGVYPRLQLHELTRRDIVTYVTDVIGGHAYMQRLIARQPLEAGLIMEELVEKSSGVFLWVILACRSLLSGFDRTDRIAELRRLVDELPPELEDMFRHMLLRVDKRSREQGARLLRICHAAKQGKDRATKLQDISTLGLALIDQDQYQAPHMQVLTKSEKRELCKEISGRLRSRCGGLLELNFWNPHARRVSHWGSCFCEAPGLDQSSHDGLIDSHVEFLHRTVFEFLSDPKVWNLDCLRVVSTQEPGPAASLSLCNLFLASQSFHSNPGQLEKHLLYALYWGGVWDQEQPDCRDSVFQRLHPLLDQLVNVNHHHPFYRPLAQMQARCRRGQDSSHVILALATEVGAVNFVRTHPAFLQLTRHDDPPCTCLPILYRAVTPALTYPLIFRTEVSPRPPSKDMIALLLANGANPDDNVEASTGGMWTPWMAWLKAEGLIEETLDKNFFRSSDVETVTEIAALFLAHGADPTQVRNRTLQALLSARGFAVTTGKTTLRKTELPKRQEVGTESQSLPRGKGLDLPGSMVDNEDVLDSGESSSVSPSLPNRQSERYGRDLPLISMPATRPIGAIAAHGSGSPHEEEARPKRRRCPSIGLDGAVTSPVKRVARG